MNYRISNIPIIKTSIDGKRILTINTIENKHGIIVGISNVSIKGVLGRTILLKYIRNSKLELDSKTKQISKQISNYESVLNTIEKIKDIDVLQVLMAIPDLQITALSLTMDFWGGNFGYYDEYVEVKWIPGGIKYSTQIKVTGNDDGYRGKVFEDNNEATLIFIKLVNMIYVNIGDCEKLGLTER